MSGQAEPVLEARLLPPPLTQFLRGFSSHYGARLPWHGACWRSLLADLPKRQDDGGEGELQGERVEGRGRDRERERVREKRERERERKKDSSLKRYRKERWAG